MERRNFLKAIAAVMIAPSVPLPSRAAPSFHYISLAEAAKQSGGKYCYGIACTLMESNAIFNDLPWEKV